MGLVAFGDIEPASTDSDDRTLGDVYGRICGARPLSEDLVSTCPRGSLGDRCPIVPEMRYFNDVYVFLLLASAAFCRLHP